VLALVATAALLPALVPPGAAAQDGTPGFAPLRDNDFLGDGDYDGALVDLGRLLFFDEVLGGNRNISCATCHHPDNATGDALSLPLGEGGVGLGVARTAGTGKWRVRQRVPRNSPALFNLGARQVRSLFHDGRVAVDASVASGFATPAGDDLPRGLTNVLAAQALFPLTSAIEMAGARGENEVGRAVARGRLAGAGGAWDLLARRLGNVPEYARLFAAAFADVDNATDITIVHAANAIAEFEMAAFRSDDSPFDRMLRGDAGAMSAQQQRGMNLFYGRAGCSRCHAGVLQTDGRFHSIAMPQVGPGTGGGADGRDDFGREAVTGRAADRYRFRTPSLRNVELTSPYGHAGAYASLEAMVEHYRNPANELRDYDPSQLVLPSRGYLNRFDLQIVNSPARVNAIAAANEARPTRLNGQDIAELVAFLRALTDPAARDLRAAVPTSVPSGLLTR
jgi:cytochrome c peroxidase